MFNVNTWRKCRVVEMKFKNGLTLSMDWSSGSYSSNKSRLFQEPQNSVETCELIVYNENGALDASCYNMQSYTAKDDPSLCKYVSADDVAKVIALVANMKEENMKFAEDK